MSTLQHTLSRSQVKLLVRKGAVKTGETLTTTKALVIRFLGRKMKKLMVTRGLGTLS